jgi:hypothetical protein
MELKPKQEGDWSIQLARADTGGILVVDLPDIGRTIVDEVELSADTYEVVIQEAPSPRGYYEIIHGIGRVTVPVPHSSDSTSHEIIFFQEYMTPLDYPPAW